MWKKIDEIGIFNCYQWISEDKPKNRLDEMSIEQLQLFLSDAEKFENYELCCKLRDKILEKKNLLPIT
jgi:hypothetical protein